MQKKKRHARIPLPGGCSMSTPSIHPANWKTVSASCKVNWYIFYRFYDPVHMPQGKPRLIKGMNDHKTAEGRRAATQDLLDGEMADIHAGWNIVTRAWAPMESMVEGDLTEFTLLPHALRVAATLLTCDHLAKDDIRSMLHWVPIAIARAKLDMLPVGQVKEKHVRQILERCSQLRNRLDQATGKIINCGWSVHKHNKYRSYLMILFKRIKKAGAIEINPLSDLEKEIDKSVKEPKKMLTPDERVKVDEHLREAHYPFWRFLHIFFHSGARETEIMQVKGKDVDLAAGTYTRLVKKDGVYRNVETPIKDLALTMWRDALEGCKPNDVVFGWGFTPGKAMGSKNISRNWKRLVKEPLGIDADFYWLKHLNSTETTAIAGVEAAARQNAHKSTAMVVKIYDVDHQKRENEKLKKVNNPFV